MKALQTKNLTALACLLLWMLPLVAQENAAQEACTASQSTSGRFMAYRELIIVGGELKINHR